MKPKQSPQTKPLKSNKRRAADYSLLEAATRTANALLIAAGPDMLRYLVQLREVLTAYKRSKAPPGLSELIARATGGAQ